MGDKFLPTLSKNLLENLNDQEYYDINIEVGNDPYVRVFHAHMVILNCRSPYFREILPANKNDGTLARIKLPDILPEIFQIILRYIYGGRLYLGDCNSSDFIKILVVASKLKLQELISYIQSFLIEKRSDWMQKNFNLVYQTSFEDNSFSELQKYCTDLMNKEPGKIFDSPNFTSIPENVLISLIRNNNHRISEIQIWHHVLKWGLARNPDFPSNPSSFSTDDFNTLKNTLERCIPLLKFDNLTAKEFLDNVFPYRDILPKQLFDDLLTIFLDCDYKPKKFDSKIITPQHVELISRWIDRLEITDEIKNSYEFKLIFRGSRDGFSPKKFHEICDNKAGTVSIIKVKDGDEILGGYNPTMWTSNTSYSNSENSFIFSFKNYDHILSRVVSEKYAVFNNSDRGPSFGRCVLGKGDLILMGENCYNASFCIKKTYDKPIRETGENFSVEELEVFEVFENIKN